MHRSRRARSIAAVLLAVVAMPVGASVSVPAAAATAPCRVFNVGSGATFSNLQTAIGAAGAGAKLTVTGTCTGSFSVTRKLTIQKGTTAAVLQGSGGRVLAVSGTKLVTLIGIVIKGGTATTCGDLVGLRCGGGILNTGLLTMRGVTVSANILDAGSSGDSASGAGIFNAAGARLTIADSIVNGNKATGADAAGGGITNRGRLTVLTTQIKGNSVTATRATTGRATGGGVASTAEAALAGLDGVTVSGNTASGPIALGGGIAVTDGDLDAWRSTINANRANGTLGAGGGFHWGSPTGVSLIADSTISGNIAGAVGGGVASLGDGLFLQGVTVTDNEAPAVGGVDGPAQVSASIIAGNRGTQTAAADDCTIAAADSDAGDNLIGDGRACTAFTDGVNGSDVGTHAMPIDPRLGALAVNGGPTRTHALLAGSPAIDAAGGDPCPTDRDQRNTERPQGGACDVGAFERVP